MRYAVLSVDVETDWGGRNSVEARNKGIEEEMHKLLGFLREQKIKATFFVSGNLLPKYIEQILDIKRENHEIACHGMSHRDMSKLSKEDFISEINACKDVFKKELDVELKGFRAPQFRMAMDNLDVLSETGFLYDSSFVRACFPGRYSHVFVKAEPFRIRKNLIEIPVSSVANVPLGLLWLNNIGLSSFKLASRVFGLKQFLVIYMHPFDLVSDKGKGEFGQMTNLWYCSRQKHVYRTLGRLINYLKYLGYSFAKIEEVVV